MREIKFRAWDKRKGEMFDPMPIVDFEIHRINGVALMQYTGLKDKNGKEIYEKDIIRRDTGYKFLMEAKMYKIGSETFVYGYEDCKGDEVIGNIYENPELIKEAEMSQQ